MNATIERQMSPVFSNCRHIRAVGVSDTTEQYKAPLATFLTLVASARASAAALDSVDRELSTMADSVRA